MFGLRVRSGEPKTVLAGWRNPPQHLVSKRGRLSFRPAPPPDFALSEPLPGGLQGWLRAVSDMRTCGPARRRGVRRRGSDPEQQRKRGLRSAARGQADQDRALVQRHDGKTRKNEAELQFGVRRCSRWWKRASTWEGRQTRASRRSCPSVGEWRRGARLSLEQDSRRQCGNRFGGGRG